MYINSMCKRATPSEFSQFSLVRTTIKTTTENNQANFRPGVNVLNKIILKILRWVEKVRSFY